MQMTLLLLNPIKAYFIVLVKLPIKRSFCHSLLKNGWSARLFSLSVCVCGVLAWLL